ncbi:MAG: hypothetical protein AAFX92_10390 [Pseudomonadota bacterium]
MKLLLGLLALMATMCLANAQDTIPDITGVWQTASGQILTHEGEVLDLTAMPSGDIVIEMQEGPLFFGFYRWHHPDGTRLDDGVAETNRAEETMLGVFASDGRSFIMADTPDQGYWFGIVLDENRIELRYLESGPFAAAGTSIMERAQ